MVVLREALLGWVNGVVCSGWIFLWILVVFGCIGEVLVRGG